MRSSPTSIINKIIITQTDHHRILPLFNTWVNPLWLGTIFNGSDQIVDPSVSFEIADFASTVVFNQHVEDGSTRNPFKIHQLIKVSFEVERYIKIYQGVCFHSDPYLVVKRIVRVLSVVW